MDARRKLSILWRPELARILEMNRLPRYREKSKEFVQRKLLEKVPETILWQQACEELFQRDYNTINDEIRRFRSGRNGSAKKIR